MTAYSIDGRRFGRWVVTALAGLVAIAVSLGPVACEASASSEQSMSDPTVEQGAAALKDKASASPMNMVRVIIEVQSRPGDPADTSNAFIQSKVELADIMRRAGAVIVQPIKGTPLIVMELSASQIDVLVSSGLVHALQEDRPEGLF